MIGSYFEGRDSDTHEGSGYEIGNWHKRFVIQNTASDRKGAYLKEHIIVGSEEERNGVPFQACSIDRPMNSRLKDVVYKRDLNWNVKASRIDLLVHLAS